MYLPKFSITNLILDYIVKYELSIKTINNCPLPYKIKQEIYDKNKIEEIQSVGDLLGITILYTQASRLQQGKNTPSERSKYRLFSNYRSVQEYIKTYNRLQYIQPSTHLMIHINKLILSNVIDDWEIGKIKTFSEKPNEVYDNWYKNRDFFPDLNAEEYFNEIFELLINNRNSIHRLIVLACYIYEMIDKAPFYAGNQITAILTYATLLKEFGYNPDNLLPIAKVFSVFNSELIDGFKISKSKKDLTTFIEGLLYSLSLQVLSLQNIVENAYKQKVVKRGELSIEFNPRQIRLIEYLELNKKISRIEYSKMMGVSFMTAYRDLQDLVNHDYLEVKGSGRGTIYLIKSKENENEKESLQVFVDGSLSE